MPDPSPIRDKTKPIGAWFLGPKAENAEIEEKLMNFILQDYFHWRRNYYPSDEIVIPQSLRRDLVDWNDDLTQKIAEMLAGLRKHFPFYSPRYMAHMTSDQTLPSVLGYFAGLLYNPNNVTPEAAPVTERWEFEVGCDMLEMLGYRHLPRPGDRMKHARNSDGRTSPAAAPSPISKRCGWLATRPISQWRFRSSTRRVRLGYGSRPAKLDGNDAGRDSAPASAAGGRALPAAEPVAAGRHRPDRRPSGIHGIQHSPQWHGGLFHPAAARHLRLEH